MNELSDELTKLDEIRKFRDVLKNDNNIYDDDKVNDLYLISLEQIKKGNFTNLRDASERYGYAYRMYLDYYRKKFEKSNTLWLDITDSYFISLDRKEKLKNIEENYD